VPDESPHHEAVHVELVDTQQATFEGSGYDARLVVDTTPTSRVQWNDGPSPEHRSVYDASMITDTSPTARWEPAASDSGAENSAAASGDE
jgi:hypothetical protein